jgi:hypothetical protein
MRLTLWAVVPLLLAGALVAGASSLRVSVPPEEHQYCLQAAKEAGNKNPYCPTDETVWKRGLTDPVAYYTLWLTLFTGVLAAVGIGQGYLIRQQVKLASDEFNSTHRPRLVVRFVAMDRRPKPGMPLQIWITVANVGDSRAFVRSVDGRAGRRYYEFMQALPLEKWIGGDPKETPNPYIPMRKELVNGDRDRYLIPENVDPLSQQDIDALGIKAHQLCIIGEVVYSDVAGIERRTGFFRVYDPGANTFVLPRETDTHYDYEYAD